LNKILGGVNNIEPVITEDNKYRFIDSTEIPGIDKIVDKLGIKKYYPEDEVELQVYGYGYAEDPDNPPSNFVTNIGLSTQISKNYATMITIGATANGGVPGIEATAFSRWNLGIKDRFKNNITDQVNDQKIKKFIDSDAYLNSRDNYGLLFEDFWGMIGLGGDDNHNPIDDQIKLNNEVITNWYKTEKIAKALESKEKIIDNEETKTPEIESSVGFLPFNLKIDMDGLSGIKIYNRVKVDTTFLPSNYPNTLEFIITQVNHKLSANGWETSLETIATAKNLQV
jgi:hypothetical protein